MSKKKNLLRDDPTRTLTLRNKAVSNINGKFGKIKQLISESIVKNKVFVENASSLKPESFVFLRTPEKLEAFDKWLEGVIDELILSDEIDIVVNLTPPLSHFEISYKSLKNAKHVFSEKPIALTID